MSTAACAGVVLLPDVTVQDVRHGHERLVRQRLGRAGRRDQRRRRRCADRVIAALAIDERADPGRRAGRYRGVRPEPPPPPSSAPASGSGAAARRPRRLRRARHRAMRLPVLSVADGADVGGAARHRARARRVHRSRSCAAASTSSTCWRSPRPARAGPRWSRRRCAGWTPTRSTGCSPPRSCRSAWCRAGTPRPRSGCARSASSTCVPDDADAAVVASVVTEAVRSEAARGPDRSAGTSRPLRPTPTRRPRWRSRRARARRCPPDEPARRGTVVAVWGPTGAPGRTTRRGHAGRRAGPARRELPAGRRRRLRRHGRAAVLGPAGRVAGAGRGLPAGVRAAAGRRRAGRAVLAARARSCGC